MLCIKSVPIAVDMFLEHMLGKTLHHLRAGLNPLRKACTQLDLFHFGKIQVRRYYSWVRQAEIERSPLHKEDKMSAQKEFDKILAHTKSNSLHPYSVEMSRDCKDRRPVDQEFLE